MMFVLGMAVGCTVAVLLIYTLANITRQKPTNFMIESHNTTLNLLKEANRHRERIAYVLEKIAQK